MVTINSKTPQKQKGVEITEKEYRKYKKRMAKETLRKLKYPNGKPEDKIAGFRHSVL